MFTRRSRPAAPTPVDQATLRRQADQARERVLDATVRRVPPPTFDVRTNPRTVVAAGCLLCGLAAVEVPASLRLDGVVEVPALTPNPDRPGGHAIEGRSTFATDRAALRAADVDVDRLAALLWYRIVCRPQTIGAPPSGRTVTGYLCPTCDDAVAAADALGTQAISAALGLDAANVEVSDVRGLTFGALVLDARRRGHPEPPPGRTRWEHVRVDTSEPDPPAVGPVPADALLWVPWTVDTTSTVPQS